MDLFSLFYYDIVHRKEYDEVAKVIQALETLSATHAFNYIVLRANPGLTSCEDLATALGTI